MKIKFAFYYPPYKNLPAQPSFLVEESDRLDVEMGSNLGITELLELLLPIPYSPTYEEWVAMGKPVRRPNTQAPCHVCLRLAAIGPIPNLVHFGIQEAI